MDHFLAPILAEVDIEVRHRNAFGIQNALEQPAKPKRVEVGDGERAGHQRAGARAAARTHRYPLAFDHLMKSATIRK